jgi:phosphopantothenoylcysteine synthetase/decarboxylase
MGLQEDRPQYVLDLQGFHIVVTAGGTREPIDPIRFIGNRSSGPDATPHDPCQQRAP